MDRPDDRHRSRDDQRTDDRHIDYDRSVRGLDSTSRGPLAHLSELDDCKIADGEPDIRGWDLKTAIGRDKLGEVTDLLVDTAALQVRYIEVKLAKDAAEARALGDGDADPRVKPTRYVLIPIGLAHLDDDHDDVLVEASALDLPGVPPYERGRLDREYEHALLAGYGARADDRGRAAARPSDRTTDREAEHDFYDDARFDDRSFFGRRREGRDGTTYVTRNEEQLVVGTRAAQTGSVGVRKSVETEHVRESVPVTREEVTVERRPVSAGAAHGTEVQVEDGEIRVPVMAEEVVTTKRVVPKEEIVIRKQAVTEHQTVEGTVRKERVQIDRDGSAEDRR